MSVCGIDLSTKAVDLVVIDEDNPALCEHLRIPLTLPWWESAQHMRRIMPDHGAYTWLHQRNVHLAGVERPFGKNLKALASLHTILGAVLCALPGTVTAFEVTPGDMRRELGLPGTCKKALMHEAVKARLNDDTWTHLRQLYSWSPDAFDAWAAAHACLRMNERGTPVGEEAAQMCEVEKIKRPPRKIHSEPLPLGNTMHCSQEHLLHGSVTCEVEGKSYHLHCLELNHSDWEPVPVVAEGEVVRVPRHTLLRWIETQGERGTPIREEAP